MTEITKQLGVDNNNRYITERLVIFYNRPTHHLHTYRLTQVLQTPGTSLWVGIHGCQMAMVLGVLKKLLIIERPFYKVKKNYQLQRGPTSFKIIMRSRHTLLLCHKNKTSFSSMNQFQVICQSIVHPIQKFQDKNFPSQQRNKPASHAITIVYYGLSKIVHSDFRYTEDVFFTEVCSIISFFSLLCTVQLQGGHIRPASAFTRSLKKSSKKGG